MPARVSATIGHCCCSGVPTTHFPAISPSRPMMIASSHIRTPAPARRQAVRAGCCCESSCHSAAEALPFPCRVVAKRAPPKLPLVLSKTRGANWVHRSPIFSHTLCPRCAYSSAGISRSVSSAAFGPTAVVLLPSLPLPRRFQRLTWMPNLRKFSSKPGKPKHAHRIIRKSCPFGRSKRRIVYFPTPSVGGHRF